jgi:hypothetical protein
MNTNLERRRRLFIIMIIIPLIFSVLLYFLRDGLIRDYYVQSTVVDLTAGLLFLISVFGFLMFYLQTGFKRGNEAHSGVNNINPNINVQNVELLKSEVRSINDKLNNLENQIKINPINLTEEKLEEIQEIIKSKIINETTEDLIRAMEAKVENNIFFEKITHVFHITLERLRREVTTLNLRSNLNLVLGIIITGVGLYLLYIFVFKGELKQDNTLSFIMNFTPKLSLVIFIEVFAFFFLSLYKTSLSEIKYYQNEMTKIETKYIALVAALEHKSNDTISEIIKEIPNLEQFGDIFNNGDLDLQESKIKADNMVQIMGKVLDIYKKAN